VSSRLADIFSGPGDSRLITYVTGGDPDATRSADILRALDRAGADVLEVGVPFSDPLADGPVIQRASERALRAGASLGSVLDLIEQVRSNVDAGVVVFTYANPILRFGVEAFTDRAAAIGVDGVLVLDLPIEEAGPFREQVVSAGLDQIFLVSPTTTDERLAAAAALGSGFLYGISRLGVTGARSEVGGGAPQLVSRIRQVSSLPVAVGFGVSHPDHVRQIGKWADGVVVGSALVDVIARQAESDRLAPAIEEYIRWLRSGTGAVGVSTDHEK
jgi:tryptophan synthase alpha chain